MKQSEMLALLKELSSDLLRYAAGSDSIVPGAYEEALDAAIKTLDRMTSISVKDILPEEDTEVLAYDGRNIWLAWLSGDNTWGSDICNLGNDITHWMPMPELPKGENNGNQNH